MGSTLMVVTTYFLTHRQRKQAKLLRYQRLGRNPYSILGEMDDAIYTEPDADDFWRKKNSGGCGNIFPSGHAYIKPQNHGND